MFSLLGNFLVHTMPARASRNENIMIDSHDYTNKRSLPLLSLSICCIMVYRSCCAIALALYVISHNTPDIL